MTSSILIQAPNNLSPQYDTFNNVYVLTNPEYTTLDFNYIVQLYAYNMNTATYSMLIQNILPPRPNTGYGVYSPYNALQSLLSYDLTPGLTNTSIAKNSMTNFHIGYGEQWNPNLHFQSFNLFDITGFFGMDFYSYPTGLLAGDLIYIQSQNPYLNGTASITYSDGDTVIYTDKVYSTASSIQTGVIYKAQRIEVTATSKKYGFNGTRQYADQTDQTNSLVMPNSPDAWCNNDVLPRLIDRGQYETLSFMFNYTTGDHWFIRYFFRLYSGAFTIVDKQISFGTASYFPGLTAGINRVDIPIGTQNLVDGAIVSSTLIGNTSQYNALIIGPSYSSTPIGYRIDTECAAVYTPVRIAWLNLQGGFEYFNFTLDDAKKYNVTKTEYKKELPYNYNIGDRGRTVLSQKVDEEHLINSNFVDQQTFDWLSGIITSPEVYVIGVTSSQKLPIIIVDNNYTFKTAVRDEIFNLSLTYQYAYQIETQRQ